MSKPILGWILGWFTNHPSPPLEEKIEPRAIYVNEGCLSAIQEMIYETWRVGHEGIVYLLGRTNGCTTMVTTAFLPRATTTPGSFDVDSVAMAEIISASHNLRLHVVGQVHTHPCEAYHSEGDIDGYRMRQDGYVSIVLPDYGATLPSLVGSAIYMYSTSSGFGELKISDVVITPRGMRHASQRKISQRA